MANNRAIRRAQTQRMIRRRLIFLRIIDPEYYERARLEPHRWAKRHPFDCGQAGCTICHAEKVLETKKRRRQFRDG
jgi:hypothetical protein